MFQRPGLIWPPTQIHPTESGAAEMVSATATVAELQRLFRNLSRHGDHDVMETMHVFYTASHLITFDLLLVVAELISLLAAAG